MKDRGPTILIVDDEPVNRKILRIQLDSAGYQVVEAVSGAEALTHAKSLPDLILLDIMMPVMDGFQTCRLLKQDPSTADIPVIFLSGLQNPKMKVAALEAGGLDYICKPFSPPELLARVKTHLTLRQQEIELNNYARKLEQMVEERTRQLLHADRLATVGVFSAAIAHEINNPLAFITMNAELLKLLWDGAQDILAEFGGGDSEVPPGRLKERAPKLLDGIIEGAQRISHTVSSLRSYARKSDSLKEPCPLIDPIQDAVQLLSYRLKQHIALNLDVSPQLLILGNRQELSQVFVNLISNSLDAMGDTPGEVTIEALPNNGWVRILFSDTGPGVPASVAEKVFDPFITTKGKISGTGLGLFVVRNIIEDHGGTAVLAPPGGSGTQFVISLPLSNTGVELPDESGWGHQAMEQAVFEETPCTTETCRGNSLSNSATPHGKGLGW